MKGFHITFAYTPYDIYLYRKKLHQQNFSDIEHYGGFEIEIAKALGQAYGFTTHVSLEEALHKQVNIFCS